MIGNSSFQQLPPFLQKAVQMKADGLSHTEIAQAAKRSVVTIDRWFSSGGLLENALMEYSEITAHAAIGKATTAARKATVTAIDTLDALMHHKDARMRLGAAKVVANKFLPDAKAIHSPSDEIPAELIERGDRVFDDATPASKE